MSVASWRREFYRVAASRVKKKDALEHSLRKWEGLTKENLRKHDVWVSGGMVADMSGDDFPIDDGTCALCRHYADVDLKCAGCPIADARGGKICDEGDNAPYILFSVKDNPIPMLRLLRMLKKRKDEGKNNKR